MLTEFLLPVNYYQETILASTISNMQSIVDYKSFTSSYLLCFIFLARNVCCCLFLLTILTMLQNWALGISFNVNLRAKLKFFITWKRISSVTKRWSTLCSKFMRCPKIPHTKCFTTFVRVIQKLLNSICITNKITATHYLWGNFFLCRPF